ncbi:MAG: hypothetical protein ACJAXZ_002870, partial [Akkermansiaceae bacterium]
LVHGCNEGAFPGFGGADFLSLGVLGIFAVAI